MRYGLWFAGSVVALTLVATATFDHISATNAAAARSEALPTTPPADTVPGREVATPANPSAADYARYAAADRAWRDTFARRYTVAELRARGDGRRTGRDSVQDLVFHLTRAHQRRRAVAELEAWVGRHPTDRGMLLSLARLLNEEGRSDDAVRRYRQILALDQRGQ